MNNEIGGGRVSGGAEDIKANAEIECLLHLGSGLVCLSREDRGERNI